MNEHQVIEVESGERGLAELIALRTEDGLKEARETNGVG